MASTPPIKLNNGPKTTDVYMWADFIELLCLTNLDGSYSRSDILDIFQEAMDIDDEIADADNEGEVDVLRPPQKNDRWNLRAKDWFANLEYRQATFGEFYPFSLSPELDVLNLKKDLSLNQKVYIFFLLASNLRYISSLSSRNSITAYFEVLSLEALQEYLPTSARVFAFGRNPLNKTGPYAKGKLYDKVKQLAEDIGEKLMCEERDFKPTDAGDGGLDIVAWLPFEDKYRGFVLLLGQCACTEDWDVKQFSISEQRWSRYIAFTVPPNSMCFIPLCYRDSNGNWDRPTVTAKTILLDRVRIIHLLKNHGDTLQELIPLQIVEEIIKYKAEVV